MGRIPMPPADLNNHSEEENVAMDDDFKGFEDPAPMDTEDEEDDWARQKRKTEQHKRGQLVGFAETLKR